MFKTIIQSIAITVLVFGVIIALGVGVCALEAKMDADAWSNGICRCGGEFEFTNAAHRKNGGNYYYYHCDNCGAVIETHTTQHK